ncbi:hypothetical protein SG34_025515 [Thalassomonas viridans]|uniref:Uncharacterized protein n=1 Tax=Thalassomonas viridans TaxID=137584 RepID=A0AAF0C995_9GAMM|nr:hypothetical protein [Thalassomonas viridans]WDE04649.1 hypothetical protein SG34_025515 [Thalassomonas viridans]
MTYEVPLTAEPVVKAKHNLAVEDMLKSAKKKLLQNGYQIQRFDSEAGIISTSLKNKKLTPAEADCGKIMGLDYLKDNRSKTEMALNIIVTEQDITVKSSIYVEYELGESTQDIALTCVSRGVVENKLLKQLITG